MTVKSPPRRLVGALAAAVSAALLATALVPAAAVAAPLTPVTVDGMNLDSGGAAVINELERTEVAPGLVHVRYERLDAQGWQQVNILKATLTPETVRVGYLTPETVAGPGATVTELVDGSGAIAGVNLDRFDINNSNAAAGWGIQDGEIVKSGNPDAAASIVIDDAGLGSLADLLLQGTATFGSSSVTLGGVNVYSFSSGVGLYTSQWGAYSRARAIGSTPGVEVIVGADDTVTSVSTAIGSGQLAEGERALVARASSAEGTALATLKPGDAVTISYAVDAGQIDVKEAGGAWHRILRDGVVVDPGNPELHPRTMVGFSQDGATAYFVQIDGRTAIARGMTLTEQGQFMKDLGAWNATNADGGGSSQMNVREAGEATSTIANTPSDGYERRDGDGLGLFLSQPGSGTLVGYRLAPVLDDGEDAVRVFPGLTRRIAAKGLDEVNSSVDSVPASWTTDDSAIASTSACASDCLVTGVTPGATDLVAATGDSSGRTSLRVLDPLDHITTEATSITLETQGSSTVIELTGHDASGFVAPVEAQNVAVDNSAPGVISVEPTADGRFTLTAIGSEGTATIGFTAAGVRLEMVVAVPLEVRLIDDFTNISGWTTAHDRAPTGSIQAGEGHEGSPSIRLNYNFTESTGTRGRYAVAPGAVPGGSGGIDIPGRPQKLSVWIKGDGKGSLLRLQVMQANGVRNWIDGPGGQQSLHATWVGWQRVDFLVPESFAFPLKLERIRILETVAAKQYTGSLEFSKIYAYLPPEGGAAPATTQVEDPLVVPAGATDDDDLRVAVISDAQFVARNPDSFQVEGARKALREIVASDPDMMLLNGDFVDEASVADFELAKRILDEELAGVDFPWYYIPGNHEIMGAAIDNFRAAFGETFRTVDIDGTRIIMVNSASGKLATEFAQVQMIREQLDAAAADPAITGVLLVSHMPTNDPLPTKGSQLTDRNEAELVDDWMQEFREDSGKSAAYVGSHVGVFDVSSVDGVPYVVNGNSGKDPASSPDDGGFTGWTMLGIDPDAGQWRGAPEPWLSVETKPRVDENGLSVTAPATLVLGESGEVSAEFIQDSFYDARTVPVAWPVSSAWSGEGVFVGDAADAPQDAIVAITPAARTITAVGAGTATLQVTVNGESDTTEIVVEGPTVDRVAGENRFATAVKISQESFPESAPVVYIANGQNYPDALSAGPAAASEGGPLLLVSPNSLPADVAAEIERLNPAKIVVVGGLPSVDASVYAELEGMADEIVRLGGANRYETSRMLADYAFGDAGASLAYLSTGTKFPDALAAGGAAGANDAPVILVDGAGTSIGSETVDLLAALGVTDTRVLGDTNSVSQAVFESADAVTNAVRLAGADRYATARAINADAFESADRAFLATGANFPDALAGSAWAGKEGAPMLSVRTDCVPQGVLDDLEALGVTHVTLLGGLPSLSEAVENLTPCS